jgi:MarC family membrane protein
MNWALMLSFAAALLAIIDPIGNLPLFVSYVGQEKSAVQRWLALFLAVTVMVMLLVFFYTGQFILNSFGVSMAAFRIAGGILLLLIGIDMVKGHEFQVVEKEPPAGEHTTFGQARRRFRKLLIPLGVPLYVGPGSISTAILYAARAHSLWDKLALSMVIVFVSLVLFICMSTGRHIRKILGDSGLDISTRLLGVLLASIAVQFMLAGLSEATHGFIVATPSAITQPAR